MTTNQPADAAATFSHRPPARKPQSPEEIERLTVRHDRPARPWPWWYAFATAPIRPFETIRRVEPVAWWQALAVHAVWLGIGTAATWPAPDQLGMIVTSILVTQALFLLGPILGMPLMARPQPLRLNIMLAIKRFWLVMPCFALIDIVMSILLKTEVLLPLAPWPVDPPGIKIKEWWAEDLVSFLVAVATMAWGLILLLALRQRPWWPHCRWPAVCAGCGYTLLGMTKEQVCPECGKPIRESTDMAALYDPAIGRSWRQIPIAWTAAADYIRRRGVLTEQRTMPWLFLVAAAIVIVYLSVIFASDSASSIQVGDFAASWNWRNYGRIINQSILLFLSASGFLCLSILILLLFSRQRDRYHALVGMARALPSLSFTGIIFLLIFITAFRTATHFEAYDHQIFGIELNIWITVCAVTLFVAGAGLHVSALRRINRAARWANW